MRGLGLDVVSVVGPTEIYLLDFFYSGIQLYILLSPYLGFISFLYLGLHLIGNDTSITFMLSYPDCHARASYIGCIGTHAHCRQVTSLLYKI